MMSKTIIAHLDLDAFFASVEARDNPRFSGLPLVIGADPKGGAGRGVVSTASYEARTYGVRSALAISKAWQRCKAAERRGEPACVFLPVDGKRYKESSQSIMEIVRAHAAKVQQASVDEAYFDLSHTGSFQKAKETAIKIKNEIKRKEKLTCSIGIGPNKLVAKVASDHKKPDGLTAVTPGRTEAFLAPMGVRTLPGIGPKTAETLAKLRMTKVRDLQQASAVELVQRFGKHGESLWRRARGIGSTQIVEERVAKSVGAERTFGEDVSDANVLIPKLTEVADNVHKRFEREGHKAFKTVTVVVRLSDFTTRNRSHTLSAASKNKKGIEQTALRLFLPFLDKRENPHGLPIRLLGVRLEGLTS